MGEQHWATGPGEILQHGIELLQTDSDRNRRLAMIAIDNSVELMLQTYISLPKRINGLSLSRKTRDEICSGFPNLLDGIEEHASAKLVEIDLGEIEWFHRLRNQLYHQGNGLTVERTKVEAYLAQAERLFECLFGERVQHKSSNSALLLGKFMDSWARIERAVVGKNEMRRFRYWDQVNKLLVENPNARTADPFEFNDLRQLRNRLAHGDADPAEEVTPEVLKRVESLAKKVEQLSK